MKLRYLLLVTFGLVTAVPLVLFWAWPHASSMTNEIEEVRERNLLIARTMAAALQRYHRDVAGAFRLVHTNLAAGEQVQGAEELLQSLYFRNVCLYDIETRQLRGRVDSFGRPCPETVTAEDLAFYRALAAKRDAATSRLRAGPDGTPALFLAAELQGGIAVGTLFTDFFVELGRSVTFGERGHALLVDRSGQVLAHPDPSWQTEMRDLSALHPVRQMREGGTGVVVFEAPFLEADAIAAYTVVEDSGWGVMVAEPVEELRRKAMAVNRSALTVVALGMAAALIIGALVAYFMTRPLRAVSRAARRMAAGDAEARTPVSRGYLVPDEVRDLQTTFNTMAEAMERSKRDEHEARLKAEEANRSKSAFLANMSHELRTPLNAILGFSEVMIAETFGKVGSTRYVEYLQDIRLSARHLLDLINDLLDLSRIEAGAMKLKEDWIHLEETLEESAGMFRATSIAKGVTLQVDNQAGPVAVLTDERALRQILINLLSNAVRHTPGGGKVVLGAEASGDGGLDVFVADTGAGIPATDLERVLQPFEQARSSHSGTGEGTGLGLAIVKELVDLHGGELKLESTVGQGTTVTFRLPPARLRAREPNAAAGVRAGI